MSTESAFKIENCHITTGDFIFERERPLTLNISGQGEKLTRVGNSTYTVPGSVAGYGKARTGTGSVMQQSDPAREAAKKRFEVSKVAYAVAVK